MTNEIFEKVKDRFFNLDDEGKFKFGHWDTDEKYFKNVICLYDVENTEENINEIKKELNKFTDKYRLTIKESVDGFCNVHIEDIAEEPLIVSQQPEAIVLCKCLEEMADRIKQDAISHNSGSMEGFNIINAYWENINIAPKKILTFNFIVRYNYKKKNGETSKPKNIHASIASKFCPFCGTKIV